MPTLERSAAGIIRVRAVSGLVVCTHHFYRLSCFQVIKRQVNRRAAIMTRAFRGIGDEELLLSRRRVPEDLGHIPRSVGIMNEQSIAHLSQLAINTEERLRRMTLHEGAGLRIKDGAE